MEEVVVMEIKNSDAMTKIELLHFGHQVFDAAQPEFLAPALFIPGIDAAKGAIAIAAAAAQDVGDGLAKIILKGGAFRKWKGIQIFGIAGGWINTYATRPICGNTARVLERDCPDSPPKLHMISSPSPSATELKAVKSRRRRSQFRQAKCPPAMR